VTHRTFTLLAVVALVLGACSDGDDDDSSAAETSTTEATELGTGAPDCADWLERPVTAEEVEDGCESAGPTVNGTTTHECTDGRTLFWNDEVWGYVDEVATAHEVGAEQVAPEAERTACGI
jgi:hypothetical protein